jgi:hypothetical protein
VAIFEGTQMPSLDTTVHLDMLRDSYKRGDTKAEKFYGIEWGDPNGIVFLKFIRDQYVKPYINPDHVALEIGPGGGRWTRYLLSFQHVFVVDIHAELLDELAKKFVVPHLHPVLNKGTDFPDIPENSIDFVFSFGVFVHLDKWIIEAYLKSLLPIVKDSANIVIQYSDKTKALAKKERAFSENTPDEMRRMVTDAGYAVLEENLTALPHSSIMRFRKKYKDEKIWLGTTELNSN